MRCGCQPESGPITNVIHAWNNYQNDLPAGWNPTYDQKNLKEAALEEYLEQPERNENNN